MTQGIKVLLALTSAQAYFPDPFDDLLEIDCHAACAENML
jgi:hypothetical protein